MLKLKQFTFILIILLYAHNLKAQYITSIGVSNYGAVHSMHLNPSLSAYSKTNWQVNLIGSWANVNNNYLTLKLPFSAYKYLTKLPPGYTTESGNPTFNKAWLHENLNGNNKQVGVASDVYGPSATFKIKSWSVGFVSSAHATTRISNLSENLAHAVLKEFDSTQGAFNLFNTIQQGGENKIGAYSVVGNTRIAAGINLSKSIKLDWNRKLLVGVSIKRNWGMLGFNHHNSGMEFQTINTDSIVFQPSRMQMVTYGDQTGKGMGVDIGATYIFNKKDTKRQGGYNKNQTKYFGKFGVSIMDIGKITYHNAIFEEASNAQPVGVNLDSLGEYSNGTTDYQGLTDSLFHSLPSYRTYTGQYVVGLPTRLVLSADFQVKKNFFIAGVLTQSLRKKMSQHARYQSALMLAPRWEYRFLEFSMPLLLQYDYRSLRIGANLRFGPFYIGSNSVVSFIYTKAVRDADIFAGIAFHDISDFSFKKNFRSWKARNAKGIHGCFSDF